MALCGQSPPHIILQKRRSRDTPPCIGLGVNIRLLRHKLRKWGMIWCNDFCPKQGGEKRGRETGCGKKTAGITKKKLVPRFCEKSEV